MFASGFAELVDGIAGLDDDALTSALGDLEVQRRVLEARQAVVLAEAERRKVFTVDGHASMWGLLRSQLGWSTGECRNRMRVAHVIDEFAGLGEMLLDGQVPVAHVTEIGRGFANPRCGDQMADVIGTLSNEAGRLEYDDFRLLVERWEMLADVDGAHRDRETSHARRNAHLTVHDGIGHLDAQWGDLDAAQACEIFAKFCDAEFLTDWQHTTDQYGDQACVALMPRTPAQRRADALTAIFLAAVSAAPGAAPPEPLVNLVIDEHTFMGMLTELELLPERFAEPTPLITDRRCETTSGIPIDPYIAVTAALEGRIRRVVCNSAGVVIDMGRKQRLFTGAAHDAVMLLSTRCRWPGCRVPGHCCQADHIVEWANDSGHTRPDNGSPLCGRHNRWKHRGYCVRRDGLGNWHTYRPDGTELL